MAKMWKSVLASPTEDLTELEKIGPALTEMRQTVLKLCGPNFRKIEKAARKIDRALLKPELRLALVNGEQAGAGVILKKDGSYNDDTTVGRATCFFLWLYWPQIKMLQSTRDLELFLQEMRQDDLTRKNLEKICREIGLKFRARGRPKKPT